MCLIYLSDFKMFPLRYNFTLRFLMWQAKGGNHKGLPPLEFSPFGKPLSLTPLLRLRWRKSAVLACRPRIAALAQAPCSRETVRGLQRLTAQTFYSFKLSYLWSTTIFVFSFYIIPLSTFLIPIFNKSRHLFILTEKRSRTKLTQPLSAWRGGGGG